jgi:hypothetical protein
LRRLFGAENDAGALSCYYVLLYELNPETEAAESPGQAPPPDGIDPQALPFTFRQADLDNFFRAVQAEREVCRNVAAQEKHKAKTLEAYDWFVRTCREHGLSFFVLGGRESVLGAVRHGGALSPGTTTWMWPCRGGRRFFPRLSRPAVSPALPPAFAHLSCRHLYRKNCAAKYFLAAKTETDWLLKRYIL